jgi:hypothetical protein
MTILDELVIETREFARRRDWFEHHAQESRDGDRGDVSGR